MTKRISLKLVSNTHVVTIVDGQCVAVRIAETYQTSPHTLRVNEAAEDEQPAEGNWFASDTAVVNDEEDDVVAE